MKSPWRFSAPLGAAAAILAGATCASGQPARVDLELVLAVDVSRSMDPEEQLIQRRGYEEAFRSREVIEAILGGGTGRIAVAYVEWAGSDIQNVVVPWTLIDGTEAAERFAGAIGAHRPERLSRTSIAGALDATATLFGGAYNGIRRVIDISGDGPNNQGREVTRARDDVLKAGIVINGLPLLVRPASFGFGIENLDEYYEDCVIGGAGSFVLPVTDWEHFGAAVRRKLVLEISGLPARAIRASNRPVFAAAARDRVDCLIGEKLWEQRMRNLEGQ